MTRSLTTILRSKILRRILSGFVMVAAILSLGLVITNAQFESLNQRFKSLLELDVALVEETERLQRLVSTLQSNKRGYMLTGDQDFLTRYWGAARAIEVHSARVTRVTASRPEEQRLMLTFRAAVERYFAFSTEDIAVRAAVDRGERTVAEMTQMMATRRGSQVIGVGEHALDALHDVEMRLVEEQRHRVIEASVGSRRIAVASMVLGLLVAVIYGLRVSRDIGGALADLQLAIGAMARREELRPPLGRDDEIGEVSRSFHAMGRQLQRYAAELGERVREQERTLGELREANDALGRAMRVKSDFLATMSHELRTPLNAVIGLSDFLLGSPSEQLSQRAREALVTMRGSGSHLLALLDDILDLAKIDAGKMSYQLETFAPGALVRACVATAMPLLGDKPVDVACEVADASRVIADPQRVRQVLLNLLSNAVKFTDRGEVRVRVEREGDAVVVRIADTGMGISHQDQSALFEDFHQVRSGDARPYGGTGLGLALSRRMARAMGGDVTVESEPGRGSTFSLHVTRAPEEADHA